MFHYNLIMNDRKKVGERTGISNDLCTPALGQGARVSGSISSSWQASMCVLNPLCSSCKISPPHPLGPLPVLNSIASWPKGSIFSLVSPVQPLDRITHRYSYSNTLAIRPTRIYTYNTCRIKKTAQKKTQLIDMPDLFKSADTHFIIQ